jgi:aspartate kinase
MKVTTDILQRLAQARISVDMMAQVEREDGRRQLQLTVKEDELDKALFERLLEEHGGESIDLKNGLTRVAMVGSGMYGLPGVYARAFAALEAAAIEVHAVSSSSISISLLVTGGEADRSLQVLHEAFDLGEDNK